MIHILAKIKLSLIFLFMLLLTTGVGCNGCKSDDQEKLTKEELEKKRREEREALVASDLISVPADAQRVVINFKPGHWHEITQRFKSNREDLQVMMVGGVYYGNDKAVLPSTNFINEYSRRTILPKGQEKSVSLQVYVPPTTKRKEADLFDPTVSTALKFGTELRSVPLMSPIPNSDKRPPANELKPYTFQLAVLSPQPLVYQYLANLDAIRWGTENDISMEDGRILSYDVTLIGTIDNQYSFPHSLLTMTSIAVLIWDDVSVNDLSEAQQNAILDWVHWGGQLIISGPTSWARLQGSFLSPYLPPSAETVSLNTDDFAAMSATWKTRLLGNPTNDQYINLGSEPISGLRFQLNPLTSFLPGTGDLVTESVVGRGRVVVTGFSMREAKIRDSWPYFSSFLSTGLLRRLPREIKTNKSEMSQKHVWSPPFSQLETAPQLHSNVRLLSRDLLGGITPEVPVVTNTNRNGLVAPSVAVQNDPEPAPAPAPKMDDLASEVNFEPQAWSGAAGWNDYSGVATEAISSLRAAAGIELPSRSTILKLLGGYLICLVPLNWFVFRMFRRLEYAWLAVPIMAVAGVIIVGKIARLDIGFARRTTEISVLEMYGGYNRAHLTQYVALYTSLSTNYTIEFPETDSVALPMGDVQREFRRAQVTSRGLQTNYGRADGVVLEPLTVYSNSTEMIHSEQMVKLDSSIRLVDEADGTQSVLNTSVFPLMGATVLRRGENGLEVAWLDKLDAGEKQPIEWEMTSGKAAFDNWSDRVNTQRAAPSPDQLSSMDDIWIGGLLYQIGMRTPLMRGQVRLIGYTNKTLGGLKISPSQDQYDQACVVVAHLSRATLSRITPDKVALSRGVVLTTPPMPEKGPDSEVPPNEIFDTESPSRL
jgi:hypothetical protein